MQVIKVRLHTYMWVGMLSLGVLWEPRPTNMGVTVKLPIFKLTMMSCVFDLVVGCSADGVDAENSQATGTTDEATQNGDASNLRLQRRQRIGIRVISEPMAGLKFALEERRRARVELTTLILFAQDPEKDRDRISRWRSLLG